LIGSWFYLRISYPWGDEYKQGSKVPEESSYLHDIPIMHLRASEYKPPIKRAVTPPIEKPKTPSVKTPDPEPVKEEEEPKKEEEKNEGEDGGIEEPGTPTRMPP